MDDRVGRRVKRHEPRRLALEVVGSGRRSTRGASQAEGSRPSTRRAVAGRGQPRDAGRIAEVERLSGASRRAPRAPIRRSGSARRGRPRSRASRSARGPSASIHTAGASHRFAGRPARRIAPCADADVQVLARAQTFAEERTERRPVARGGPRLALTGQRAHFDDAGAVAKKEIEEVLERRYTHVSHSFRVRARPGGRGIGRLRGVDVSTAARRRIR